MDVNHIDTYESAVILQDFGFYVNGTYNVTFSEINTEKLFYALLLQDDFPLKMLLRVQVEKFCKGQPPIPEILVQIPNTNSTFDFSGKIQEEGIYSPIVYNCGGEHISVVVKQIFRNPDTFLDFRWKNGEFSDIVTSFLSFLILILWFINWFTHFRTNVKIHYFVSSNIIFFCCYQTANYFELSKLDSYDNAATETTLKIIFTILSTSNLFITLLLAAKGWCISRLTLTFKDVFLSVIYVALIDVFNSLLNFGNMMRLDVVWSILAIVSLGLFLRELFISANRLRMHFIGHLYVISNSGIIPNSTPIYAKFKLCNILKYSIVGCFVFVICDACLVLFIEPSFWIDHFVLNIIQLCLSAVLCFIFRFKKNQSEDQFMDFFEEDNECFNDEPQEEIWIGDLEALDLKQILEKEGTVWDSSIKLPKPPKLMKTKQRKNESLEMTLLNHTRRDISQEINGENRSTSEEGEELYDLDNTQRRREDPELYEDI